MSENWHVWFAWYPVVTNKGVRWLVRVNWFERPRWGRWQYGDYSNEVIYRASR